MSLYCAHGGEDFELSSGELRDSLFRALDKLGRRTKVLAVPPDQTRTASRAGELTNFAWNYYGDALRGVLPALGTDKAMSAERITGMFGDIPLSILHSHQPPENEETVAVVPKEFIYA